MKKSLKILSITLMLVLILSLISIVNAATGSFSVSPTSKTLEKGKTTTITITAKNCGGEFAISSSDTSVATVNKSSDWIESGSSTITITAKKAGTAIISIKASDVADTSDNPQVVTGTKKVTIKVTDSSSNTNTSNSNSKDNTTTSTTQKSNNAYLSTLGVTPKEYDFSGFSKTKTSYSVTVPNDVDSLKVSYKTADPKATVKVTGNSGFDVGSNNAIKVVVTAEDGKTTKTYTIKVTKLATEDDKPGNLIEEDIDLYLTSLSIDDLELSPEFAKDTYSYSATLSNSDVTDLKVEAKANNDKANIDISGNTGLVEGENTINIILTLEGSAVKTVYQVVVTKDVASVATTSENAQTSSNDLIGSIKRYIGIAVAVIALIIVAVILLIILLRKENKRLNGEDVIEDDENQNNEEEYNVYKNDVNEFENNNNEPENFIESLYRQRNGNLYNEEELDEQDKETLEEINKETDNIFRDKVQGQSVEYDNTEFGEENPLEERRKRRGKGKHF